MTAATPTNGRAESVRHAPVVQVKGITVHYGRSRGGDDVLTALSNVSLDIERGQTVGVVGESGSGKTTLGRVILGLVDPDAGEVLFDGRDRRTFRARRNLRGRLQVVLQNPDWSINPALRVWRSVAEPLVVTRSVGRRGRRRAVDEMLELVGLDSSLGDRRPHQLSGGQRQRVAIARALITQPDVIVFDEAVTALDASVQTQVLNLIVDLQKERGFASLFISHDIAAVRYVADTIAVVYRGELVEFGPAARFYDTPLHEHSRELVDATPSIHEWLQHAKT